MICGKEGFMPANYVSEEHKKYVDFCKKMISAEGNEEWLRREVRAVIE